MSEPKPSSGELIAKLMFRLLPLQILLAGISVANDIVSSLFASNAVGPAAMAAVGLYAPLSTFVLAVGLLLQGGTQALSTQYMGRNQVDRLQEIFTLGNVLTFILSVGLFVLHLLALSLDWLRTPTGDPVAEMYLDHYLIGRAIGVLPLLFAMQLTGFLSLENQTRYATCACVAFVVANLAFHVLFVVVLDLEALGLALASSLGTWVFMLLLVVRFATGKSVMRFELRSLRWRETGSLFRLGVPEALSTGYFALRAFMLNGMITTALGSAGLSAFASVYTFMNVFWTVPDAMLGVSRMLIGVSVGEEDRVALVGIMRFVLRAYVPLMVAISAGICLCAEPLTNLYYHDPNDIVYQMTLWGFRVYPWCLPLSVITMTLRCYANTMGKPVFVHVITLLDALICVPAFSALLIPYFGLRGVFASFTLRFVVTHGFTVLYSWYCTGKRPSTMEDLMVIPQDFGVGPESRLDLTVRNLDEVVTVSQRVRAFCDGMHVDPRRTYLSGLCLEEMAGNVVIHGFSADKRTHTVDIRVVRKNDDLILRIADDCIPFDPAMRRKTMNPDDKASNIGIRLVFDMASGINYQHILGLNVLTIRI